MVNDLTTGSLKPLVLPKVDILGVQVSRVNLRRAIDLVIETMKEGRKIYISVPNVSVVTTCMRDESYRNAINAADIALPDGVPLVWASYLLGEYTGGRASGADFFKLFQTVSEQNRYTNYYLGGGPGGSERLVRILSERYPGLRIVGNFSPRMGELTASMVDDIVEKVNALTPDILWVGTGSPRQERFIHENMSRLKCRVAIGVGAAFYYEAGIKRRAPRWMQKVGLEWSYRILFEDPRLLWKKRYYAYLWEFAFPLLLQIIRKRIHLRKAVL